MLAATLSVLAATVALAGCGGARQAASVQADPTEDPRMTAVTPAPAPTADLSVPPDASKDSTSAAQDAPAAPPERASATDDAPASAAMAARPPIVQSPIPFRAKRRSETAAYAQRHYGISTWRLTDPKVIVEHYTVTPTFQATRNVFAPDRPDPELHELPGTCSHFIIDRDGTIHQVVPLSTICRHTVGLNYTAIGIEHVGMTQQQVLADAAQMRTSLRLTQWLRCRYGIKLSDVIGHNESRSSPYHHEDVAALANQTHADWPTSAMRIYRRKLANQPPCRPTRHATPAG